MTSPVLWYLDRATGIVALALMSLTIVLGVVVRRQRRLPGLPPSGVVGLHRSVSLVSAVFLAVHILSAVVDTYVPVGWPALVLPFASGWRPFAVGLGTIAVDLMVAVIVTSLVRGRLPVRLWRGVHLTVYLLWPLALLHGITAGTDLHSAWAIGVVALCTGAVATAAAAAWTGRATPAADRAPAALRASSSAMRRGAPVHVFRNR